MIVVYHAARPYLPLLACYRHLGCNCDEDCIIKIGQEWNWQHNPLLIPGKDSSGMAVGCLAHGRYRGLYQRALAGTAAIFGQKIAWVDIDQYINRQIKTNLPGFIALTLASHFPGAAKQYFSHFVRDFFEEHFTASQEGQR